LASIFAGDLDAKSLDNMGGLGRPVTGSSRCEEKRMKHVSLFGLALGASVALVAPASAQDITIGVAGPMTGQYAAFGTQFKNGMDAAIEKINASGGVLGKKLKASVGDDACDPKQARSVAEKLSGEKVPVVIGHFCSGSSIPASEVYSENGI